jgi:hypothetical protein
VVSVGVEEDFIEVFDNGVLEVAGDIENVEVAKAKMSALTPRRFLVGNFIAVSS